jgi:hypothetical protein
MHPRIDPTRARPRDGLTAVRRALRRLTGGRGPFDHCAACGRPIVNGDGPRLRGYRYHPECALYSPRGRS